MLALPRRFVVWEAEEFQTGVVQVCNTETLHYNFNEYFRIYPEAEPNRAYNRVIRGRLTNHHWNNGRPNYGRSRVQIRHDQTSPIFFVLTDFLVTPFNLHTGQQLDDELPLVLIFGEYLYGSHRPHNNYSFELSDAHRWRNIIEDMYIELLNAYNLPPMRHQPAVWEAPIRERRRRRPTPPPRQLEEILEERPPPPPTLSRPSERIALAIARDFQRQGETCPITQEPLKVGDICVTGCLCVFQGDALQAWARGHSSCPSCRKNLIYRTVTVGSEENIMIGN